MAKLLVNLFEGCIGNVCVYQMNGRSYLRSKSSLTRKRVLKSKPFEKTRKYASDMGRAARIGSVIYSELPVSKRKRFVYQAITGEAASLLYNGNHEQYVRDMLRRQYVRR